MIVQGLLMILAVVGQTQTANVRVETLAGPTHEGNLIAIDDSSLKVSVAGDPIDIPIRDILRVQVGRLAPAPTSTITIVLREAGELRVSRFTSDGRRATVDWPSNESPQEPLVIPLEEISAVIFGPMDGLQSTHDCRQRAETLEKDLLLAERKGKQGELIGTVGPITNGSLQFTIQDETIEAPRDRIRSIYFAHPRRDRTKPALLHDRFGNAWPIESLRTSPEGFAVHVVGIGDRLFPISSVASIDLSAGRSTYLSDLDPTIEHVPYFDQSWPVGRDRRPDGSSFELGGVSFAKGWSDHSKTRLSFPLGGSFKRLLTTVGIDDRAGPLGTCPVTITGDGHVLWQETLVAGGPPIEVSVPIEGVRRLELFVDYGARGDLGDQVIFADARLVE